MRLTTVLAIFMAAHALAMDMKDIRDPSARIEKVATSFQFVEGPVWSSKGYLLFSDVPADAIYRYTPGKGVSLYRKPSRHANGLTFDRQGRLVACESEGRVSRTERDGRITTVAACYEGKALNSPNDVACRADGSVYFSDPTYGMRPPNVAVAREPELSFRGLYRAKDGVVTLLDKDFTQPNGLAFSPDGKRLYVDDSERGLIRVYDVREDGSVSHGRLFAELKAPGKDGAPDGMKVDTKGNVYCTGPGGIWVLAPDGKLLGTIEPPEVPSNIAFGGEDMKTLYITARTSLYRVRLKVAGRR